MKTQTETGKMEDYEPFLSIIGIGMLMGQMPGLRYNIVLTGEVYGQMLVLS